MASLPDEVYQYIASMMHPTNNEGDISNKIHHHKLGSDIDLYNFAEGIYDMHPNFPLTVQDQAHVPSSYPRVVVDGDDAPLLAGMRFGLCLVRIRQNNKNTNNETFINVLLDAGLGPFLPDLQKCSGHPVPCPPSHALPELLASLNDNLQLTLADIDYVIHSHCHGDHVGWVGHFPKAQHVMHQKEYDFATYAGCPWRNDAVERFAPIQAEGRLQLVQGDRSVLDAGVPQITLCLADGHTPGHVCVEIQSQVGVESNDNNKKNMAIYIGDAMHFSFQVERPDLVPLFDCCAWKVRPQFLPPNLSNTQVSWSPSLRQAPSSSWNETTSSQARKAILQRLVDQDALLVSPHFMAPGMGYVATKKASTMTQGKEDNENDKSDGAISFVYTPVSIK